VNDNLMFCLNKFSIVIVDIIFQHNKFYFAITM
jgi:hypothetical protein